MKTLKINNLGTFTLDQCQKIKIKDICKKVEQEAKKEIMNIELDVSKLTKTKCNYGGERLWFLCPECNRKTSVLYKHPINSNLKCRLCTGLKYKKQRYKGMLEEKIGNLE